MTNLNEFNLIEGINLEKSNDLELSRTSNEFENIVKNAIDKGAEFIIKASPLNPHIKDILIDVKDALKTKDFKEILKTAVNSSIREGIEILNLPKTTLKNITNIANSAFKGGLPLAINTTLDIFIKKKYNGNIFFNYISSFASELKSFVNSRSFKDRVTSGVNKVTNNIENFKELCQNWHNSYNNKNLDIEKINQIALDIKKKSKELKNFADCIRENNVIQNMTELINSKKDKLSDTQLEICSSLA